MCSSHLYLFSLFLELQNHHNFCIQKEDGSNFILDFEKLVELMEKNGQVFDLIEKNKKLMNLQSKRHEKVY